MFLFFFFFFQAEDGIRDYKVTGVQTCALPISDAFSRPSKLRLLEISPTATRSRAAISAAIGAASDPEPLPHAMQPNPARWKPSASSAADTPAFASIAGTTREPGENDVLIHGF